MLTRTSSSPLILVIAFTLVVISPFLSRADSSATAPATSTNAASVTPVPSPAPTPTPPVPAAMPAATDTNATASESPTERPATYTIAQGDSLWVIAHKYGITVVQLRKANHLKKGALLHPGQVLQLPPAKDDATAK